MSDRRVRRRRRATACLLILAALLAGHGPGEARAASTSFYVAPWGSNVSPGTKAKPWRTIQKALNALRAGQTAFVRRGTYREAATFWRSGSPSSPITLRAYPGERPIVTGRLKITGQYLRVMRLIFRGSSFNRTGALIYVSGAAHIVIARNVVRDGRMSGIYVGDTGDPSHDITIIRNNIHDNGRHANQDHGIYCDNCLDSVIANNIIAHNYARGIQLYDNPKRTLVTENTIVSNLTGIVFGGEGTSTADDNLVVNNIIAYNRRFGVSTYWPDAVGTGNEMRRNLVFGNKVRNIYVQGVAVRETILKAPRFVDPAHRRYHLRFGSPAINRAMSAYSEPIDYDGDRRPKGSAPDLGMDERR
jgi:parallel beta-helix repeat protein